MIKKLIKLPTNLLRGLADILEGNSFEPNEEPPAISEFIQQLNETLKDMPSKHDKN